MAFTLPVYKLDRFTLEIPTWADSSLRDIFLSAITRSKRSIIAIAAPLKRGVVLALKIRAVLKDPGQNQQ